MSTPPEAARSRGRRRAGSEPVPSRAGRNLPAAITVGVIIGVVVLGSLLLKPEFFVIVVVIGVVAALWELTAALSRTGSRVARVPTMVGGACMVVAAYYGGAEALWVTLALSAGAVVLWGVLERRSEAVRSVSLGVFALGYVGMLASFAVLMLAHEHGTQRVIVFIAVVVSSDVGGYAVGVLFGKHPIAARISPKKSWEGFAGSAVTCMLVGFLLTPWLLGAPWWTGIVLGLAIAVIATVGDFSESMIKRDLQLKDMGTLLPGHGGVMDRLDSILPAAPVAYLLFLLLPGLS